MVSELLKSAQKLKESYAMLSTFLPIKNPILVNPGVTHSVTLHSSRDECSVTEWVTAGLTRVSLGQFGIFLRLVCTEAGMDLHIYLFYLFIQFL